MLFEKYVKVCLLSLANFCRCINVYLNNIPIDMCIICICTVDNDTEIHLL